jgi:hypothetical protein
MSIDGIANIATRRATAGSAATQPDAGTAANSAPAAAASPPPSSTSQVAADHYSPADRKIIEQLKARDQEVRSHEAAHKAVAGPHARGGAHFSYQRGPDGARYAIGGEVQIDLSPVSGDPQATLHKAEQLQAAALAPAQPSSQDYAVAAHAAQMAAQARQELHSQAPTSNGATGGDAQSSADASHPAQTAASNGAAVYRRHAELEPDLAPLLNVSA